MTISRSLPSLRILLAALLLAAATLLPGCDKANDDRIPGSQVFLPFTQGQWNVYGPGGAGQSQLFIKHQGIPSGFPYAAMHETGYAGILIAVDYMGNPVAYSPACPVERSNNVLIHAGTDDQGRPVGICATCGSTFDIFANQGTPLSGPAHSRKYALTRYQVVSDATYPVIVRD